VAQHLLSCRCRSRSESAVEIKGCITRCNARRLASNAQKHRCLLQNESPIMNCATAEAQSACWTSVNDTLTNVEVCPPQSDGSLALSPNNTCCQALADVENCWDSLGTQDEAPLWTVGGKEYGM